MPDPDSHQKSQDTEILFHLLEFSDDAEFKEIVEGLTKGQMMEILMYLPDLMKVLGEEKIKYLIKRRYRRYVFRAIYLMWQDNFEANDFRNLMLYVLNIPKTALYLEEIGFTVDELRGVVLADSMLTKFVEMSMDLGISVREFLGRRKIGLTSYLAMDAMCVFFLFCSGEDCMAFGSTKLIWALDRFDTLNQAKVINNFYSKLPAEKRREMPELIRYVIAKHGMPDLRYQNEFWSLIHMPVVRDIIDDHNSLSN